MSGANFGKYRLLAELGHGGMADVFLAVVAGPLGSGFSKLTVIKRLRQNLAEDPEFVAMLVDEARIAARLNHPNVVQTNEVGQVDGQYFIAMEYLDGQPLHRVQFRVAKETTPTVTKAMQYLVIVDALAGLHHAHDLNDYDGTPLQIVHRDVTPHNIFVTYDGQVKVVDFGIAKAIGRASETRQGVVKGKVRYMAPEQAIGQALDRRADIFSVGIMLWEAAVGRRMWKDTDDLQIVQALVAGDVPVSPRSINPDVPEGLDKICKKALSYSPEDRYATAEDFRTDLEQFLADSGLLVEARRKLGPQVGELFKDKRAEIKQVIEKQLTEMAKKSSGDSRPAFIAFETSTSPTPSAQKALTVSLPEDATAGAEAAAASTKIYEAPAKSPRRFVLPAVVAMALGIGGAWALSDRASGAVGSATIDHTTRAEIDVSLKAEPANAVIKLDDRTVGSSFDAKLPRDGKEHRIEVSAEGFTTRIETVTFAANVERSFRLEKAAVAAPSTTSTASASEPKATASTKPAGKAPPAAPPIRTTTTSTPSTTGAAPEPPTRAAPAPPEGSARKKREIDKTDPWGSPTP